MRFGTSVVSSLSRSGPDSARDFKTRMAAPSFLVLLYLIVAKTLANAFNRCSRSAKAQKKAEMLGSSAVIEEDPAAYREMRALAAGSTSTNSDDKASSLATALVAPHNVTFPSLIELVLQHAFPFPLLGSLHVSSQITVPDMARLLKSTGLNSSSLPANPATQVVAASWKKDEDKPHKRGVESTFNVKLMEGEAALWESKTKILFFKKRERGDAQPAPLAAATAPMPSTPTLPVITTLALPSSLPKEWTRLTGDSNPIHVWWPFAWLFGFRSGKRVVGHGMSVVFVSLPHVVAKLASASASSSSANGGSDGLERGSFQLDVSFLRPVFVPGSIEVHVGEQLPATVAVDANTTSSGKKMKRVSFELVSGNKIAIQGTLSFAPSSAS